MKDNINPFSSKKHHKEETAPETEIKETAAESPEENNNEETDKLKKELEELNSLYLRMAADFDNYRKRQAQERESLLKYGAEETLKKLLPVLDTFDRAKQSLDEIEDVEKLRENIDVIYKQLTDTIDKIGLKVIETKDKEFDPNMHEAVMQTPTSDYAENTIINELQKGYMLENRVIRPSLVNVATEE